jgi:hypothetical protein
MAHKGGLVISLNRKIGAAWLRSKSSPHHRDESQSGKSRRIRFSPVSQMEDQQGQFPAYSILALAFSCGSASKAASKAIPIAFNEFGP